MNLSKKKKHFFKEMFFRAPKNPEHEILLSPFVYSWDIYFFGVKWTKKVMVILLLVAVDRPPSLWPPRPINSNFFFILMHVGRPSFFFLILHAEYIFYLFLNFLFFERSKTLISLHKLNLCIEYIFQFF